MGLCFFPQESSLLWVQSGPPLSQKFRMLPPGLWQPHGNPPALHFLSWGCVPHADATNLEGKHNYQLWQYQLRFWTDLNSDLRGGKLKGECSSLHSRPLLLAVPELKTKPMKVKVSHTGKCRLSSKWGLRMSSALLENWTSENKAASSPLVAKSLNSGACLGSNSTLSLNISVILG